jgi:hypothetical protein
VQVSWTFKYQPMKLFPIRGLEQYLTNIWQLNDVVGAYAGSIDDWYCWSEIDLFHVDFLFII